MREISEHVDGIIIYYQQVPYGPLMGKWTFKVPVQGYEMPEGIAFNTLEWAQYYAYEQATRGKTSMWGHLN